MSHLHEYSGSTNGPACAYRNLGSYSQNVGGIVPPQPAVNAMPVIVPSYGGVGFVNQHQSQCMPYSNMNVAYYKPNVQHRPKLC